MSTSRRGSAASRTVSNDDAPFLVSREAADRIAVGLLTGGDDRSYALGLTSALIGKGVAVDFIGSDKLDGPELHGSPLVCFLNLRGDQSEDASLFTKMRRLLVYYLRLMRYAAGARPRILHILWNNKFELFDRTLLMGYYRLCGRKVALTAHNVNAAKRDTRDTLLNRFSLRVQYRLADHIFVHTEAMARELQREFGVPARKISVIPFGINDTSPRTDLTPMVAKQRLGLRHDQRTLLFFGQIAPYKGLEYLIAALPALVAEDDSLRLIIAGKIKKGSDDYWREVQRRLCVDGTARHVILRIEHIPDRDIELYFNAADALVVPYVRVFQSGVPFLAYSFGLPVIVTDVGGLRDDVIEGKTGLVCKHRDSKDLARTIQCYFESDIYRHLEAVRPEIIKLTRERHSWTEVGEITRLVYGRLLRVS